MKIILIILTILIPYTSCFADPEIGAPGMQNNIWSSVLMFTGLFALMYFMIVRPQTKKAKKQKELISNLKIGDEIVTTSGIFGKIYKINDNFFLISISNNTEIMIQKQAVAGAIPNGTIRFSK